MNPYSYKQNLKENYEYSESPPQLKFEDYRLINSVDDGIERLRYDRPESLEREESKASLNRSINKNSISYSEMFIKKKEKGGKSQPRTQNKKVKQMENENYEYNTINQDKNINRIPRQMNNNNHNNSRISNQNQNNSIEISSLSNIKLNTPRSDYKNSKNSTDNLTKAVRERERSNSKNRSISSINTVDSGKHQTSVDLYLQRRHTETQEKIRKLKNEKMRNETLELRDRPKISENSRKIVEKIVSTQTVFDRLTSNCGERKKIEKLNRLEEITKKNTNRPVINETSEKLQRTIDDLYKWHKNLNDKKQEIYQKNQNATSPVPNPLKESEEILKDRNPNYLKARVEDRLIEKGLESKYKLEEAKENMYDNTSGYGIVKRAAQKPNISKKNAKEEETCAIITKNEKCLVSTPDLKKKPNNCKSDSKIIPKYFTRRNIEIEKEKPSRSSSKKSTHKTIRTSSKNKITESPSHKNTIDTSYPAKDSTEIEKMLDIRSHLNKFYETKVQKEYMTTSKEKIPIKHANYQYQPIKANLNKQPTSPSQYNREELDIQENEEDIFTFDKNRKQKSEEEYSITENKEDLFLENIRNKYNFRKDFLPEKKIIGESNTIEPNTNTSVEICSNKRKQDLKSINSYINTLNNEKEQINQPNTTTNSRKHNINFIPTVIDHDKYLNNLSLPKDSRQQDYHDIIGKDSIKNEINKKTNNNIIENEYNRANNNLDYVNERMKLNDLSKNYLLGKINEYNLNKNNISYEDSSLTSAEKIGRNLETYKRKKVI